MYTNQILISLIEKVMTNNGHIWCATFRNVCSRKKNVQAWNVFQFCCSLPPWRNSSTSVWRGEEFWRRRRGETGAIWEAQFWRRRRAKPRRRRQRRCRPMNGINAATTDTSRDFVRRTDRKSRILRPPKRTRRSPGKGGRSPRPSRRRLVRSCWRRTAYGRIIPTRTGSRLCVAKVGDGKLRDETTRVCRTYETSSASRRFEGGRKGPCWERTESIPYYETSFVNSMRIRNETYDQSCGRCSKWLDLLVWMGRVIR